MLFIFLFALFKWWLYYMNIIIFLLLCILFIKNSIMTWAINEVVEGALTNVTSLLGGPVGVVIGTLLALTIIWFIVMYVKWLFRGN